MRSIVRVVVTVAGVLALSWSGAGISAQQAVSSVAATTGDPVASAQTVIYLVRHAEKMTENPADPLLTPQGTERAEELARMLRDTGITTVFSTATVRTRSTSRPTAEWAGVPIESYDPQDGPGMTEFIARLLSSPGRTLVVGHSNTTPELVTALGGDAVSPMADEDYDRLYVLTVGSDGSVSSILLHFGDPSGGE